MKKFTSEVVQARRHTRISMQEKSDVSRSHKERKCEKNRNYIAALFTIAQTENYKYRRQKKKPTEYKRKPPKPTSKQDNKSP